MSYVRLGDDKPQGMGIIPFVLAPLLTVGLPNTALFGSVIGGWLSPWIAGTITALNWRTYEGGSSHEQRSAQYRGAWDQAKRQVANGIQQLHPLLLRVLPQVNQVNGAVMRLKQGADESDSPQVKLAVQGVEHLFTDLENSYHDLEGRMKAISDKVLIVKDGEASNTIGAGSEAQVALDSSKKLVTEALALVRSFPAKVAAVRTAIYPADRVIKRDTQLKLEAYQKQKQDEAARVFAQLLEKQQQDAAAASYYNPTLPGYSPTQQFYGGQ